jgi:hypothetical protein
MKRRFGWAVLVVVGMMVGYALHSLEPAGNPLTPSEACAADPGADLIKQIGEIKTQVKDINTFLKSGNLRVTVIINPETP